MDLIERFRSVRQQTLQRCAPLETEDYQIQPMDDASPPKWHLAHVTWFFETFLLKPLLPGYSPFNELFETLFNSYYNGVGQPFTRAHRGFLSRPTLNEVLDYRASVDAGMLRLMQQDLDDATLFRIELGLHHEQQHQELILTDLKFNFGHNPMRPVYQNQPDDWKPCDRSKPAWCDFPGGLIEIGASRDAAFVFDNETPVHQVFLQPFELASHPVSCGEFIEFIEDDGYNRSELWLSDGWAHLQALRENRWQMPLYWRKTDDTYIEFGLTGEHEVDAAQPVVHVSGYEADAFARWRGARLPTEAEWEYAASGLEVSGNFFESGWLHPRSGLSSGSGLSTRSGLSQMFGDVWEWTSSSYSPYPGYKPFAGQLGEYNGKFMANQLVLRGGSVATPASHIRSTYRNFFYPPDRWQFSGIRLAKD